MKIGIIRFSKVLAVPVENIQISSIIYYINPHQTRSPSSNLKKKRLINSIDGKKSFITPKEKSNNQK
jgi:hypothetical protein